MEYIHKSSQIPMSLWQSVQKEKSSYGIFVVARKLRALGECVIPNLSSAIHLNMSLSSLG